jgi:hypothetical protein
VQHVVKQKKEVEAKQKGIPNSGMKMRRYTLLKMNSMDLIVWWWWTMRKMNCRG